MRVTSVLLFAALTVGCNGNKNKAEAKAPVPAPEAQPEVKPSPKPAPPAGKSPKELYAECENRVEKPEKDGECKTDADCAKAGCGSEVCTSKASAKDVMTTCEQKPCFQVLDTCGCSNGTCSWTLKDKAPPPAPPNKLPTKLP